MTSRTWYFRRAFLSHREALAAWARRLPWRRGAKPVNLFHATIPHFGRLRGAQCWRLGICLITVLGGLAGGWPAVFGADLTPSMGRPATQRKHFQGDQCARAGNPQCISPLAQPTESPHEEGYSMGGGSRQGSRCGGERHCQEGVWGTDYTGILFAKHTHLQWWHGARYQGGTGSYGTDGPRLVHRP